MYLVKTGEEAVKRMKDFGFKTIKGKHAATRDEH